jgi:O-antigen/teichoic acid export membrane protein
MSRFRKAARATVVVQVFNILGALLSLATVPLYLRWLGQERYGLLLTGLAFAGYLMFSDAGLSWSSMLLIAQANGRNDRKGIAAIVRNSFSLAGCSALLVGLVVTVAEILLLGTNFPWLPHHPEAAGLLVAIGCSVMSTLFLSPFYNLFFGLQEAHLSALYQGSGRILGTIAALVVASTGAPLGLVFGSNVVCGFLVGVTAALHCVRKHPWIFEKGSFWDTVQIRQQLRTGAKSFAMQIGAVLSGTAPVLAISSVAGPQFVPYFSIPLTLLNMPMSLTASFNANLQAGYGEAIGRNETVWVADAVRRILKHVILFISLLSVGFFLLARLFVHQWTGGRIEIPPEMLGSVWIVAVAGSLLGVFRFALAGINRHRIAAASDLVYGGLAMIFATVSVRWLGFQWVGFGILGAVMLTSGWILPYELRRTLGTMGLWPQAGFWIRQMAAVCAAAAAGWMVLHAFPHISEWLILVITGLTIGIVYGVMIFRLLSEEWNYLTQTFARLFPGLTAARQ